MLAGLLGDEELAFDVDSKDLVDIFAGYFVEVAKVLDSSVALDDIVSSSILDGVGS